MTASHTPGPWVAKGRYIGVENHMSYIAECRDYNGNWTNAPIAVANARLIAAAPELLHALELARDHLEVSNYEGKEDETLALINAAIAKAKGA